MAAARSRPFIAHSKAQNRKRNAASTHAVDYSKRWVPPQQNSITTTHTHTRICTMLPLKPPDFSDWQDDLGPRSLLRVE